MNSLHRPRPRIIWLLAVLLSVALLSGCSAITGKREPFTTYAPRYTAPAAADHAASVEWQLAIELPLSSDALDTRRMAIMPTPGVLQVYKGARWRDAPPALFRSLLLQAFEESGRILGVAATTSGLRADYSLAIELREFNVDYRQGVPNAAIGLNAKLIDYASNRILFARTFSGHAAMASANPDDAAKAFETALAEVLPRMVAWTLQHGEENWIGRAAAPPKKSSLQTDNATPTH